MSAPAVLLPISMLRVPSAAASKPSEKMRIPPPRPDAVIVVPPVVSNVMSSIELKVMASAWVLFALLMMTLSPIVIPPSLSSSSFVPSSPAERTIVLSVSVEVVSILAASEIMMSSPACKVTLP